MNYRAWGKCDSDSRKLNDESVKGVFFIPLDKYERWIHASRSNDVLYLEAIKRRTEEANTTRVRLFNDSMIIVDCFEISPNLKLWKQKKMYSNYKHHCIY
jgi:predicted transglutaminase-like protease